MERIARHVFVSGRVQGVGFRWFVRQQALALGVSGWVQNLPDSRVEAWIEGSSQAVTAMVERLHRGKPPANVEGVEAEPCEPEGFRQFEVR